MLSKKIAILPCAGHGSRFGDNVPKQYMLINGKTILEYTVKVFLSMPGIDQVIIVTASDDTYIDSLSFLKHNLPGQAGIQILKVGGSTRTQTVKNAVNILNCNDGDWLLVHDVARCCIKPETILRQINELENDEVGGILAIKATDTIKQSVIGQQIDKTLNRNIIYQAQTPQMFRSGILKKALNCANLELVTDEASAVEQLGLPVKLVEGERGNIKVTYPVDAVFAKIILDGQS
ncbi:MAG: 2-C-methyl-D-erythritol 4-phosphate cytidylyltransferase [Burkholderiales bacterium]|jgi:2-C-methyl-D-erythritol 4-phosphate cytidylyltransferase|nr:2-C-methyl-D-erythritol 4-phosphate cytidylyltransferase [Burkholderiales bacterium]